MCTRLLLVVDWRDLINIALDTSKKKLQIYEFVSQYNTIQINIQCSPPPSRNRLGISANTVLSIGWHSQPPKLSAKSMSKLHCTRARGLPSSLALASWHRHAEHHTGPNITQNWVSGFGCSPLGGAEPPSAWTGSIPSVLVYGRLLDSCRFCHRLDSTCTPFPISTTTRDLLSGFIWSSALDSDWLVYKLIKKLQWLSAQV